MTNNAYLLLRFDIPDEYWHERASCATWYDFRKILPDATIVVKYGEALVMDGGHGLYNDVPGFLEAMRKVGVNASYVTQLSREDHLLVVAAEEVESSLHSLLSHVNEFGYVSIREPKTCSA